MARDHTTFNHPFSLKLSKESLTKNTGDIVDGAHDLLRSYHEIIQGKAHHDGLVF
jgi:hypothetical protein